MFMAKCLNICAFEPSDYLIKTHISFVKMKAVFWNGSSPQAGEWWDVRLIFPN